MKVDYILVGFGLAGMAFAHQLNKRNKSFVVYDDNPNRPERIIGGMYNPIILKRFTPAWQTHPMLQEALPFYREMENHFHEKYIFPTPIYRILHSVEEQNNWMVASDKNIMNHYMIPAIHHKKIDGIVAEFGFGILQHVGRVAGEELLEDYKEELLFKKQFYKESFDYNSLVFSDSEVHYNNIEARHIVFAEGSYLHHNPFFNYLPMKEAKGEMLVIEVPGFYSDYIIKSGVFMVPIQDTTYIVGATYDWDDKTFDHSENAQAVLEQKLQKFLTVPYRIIDYKIGIRPTIMDRRPLLGVHPEKPTMAILNGLGTRGIILAPGLARQLMEHLEDAIPLPEESDIQRFYKKYYKNIESK